MKVDREQALLQMTAEARERRDKAVSFGRGSVRFEGFVLDEAAEALFASYVDGDISRSEMNAAVRKMAGLDAN